MAAAATITTKMMMMVVGGDDDDDDANLLERERILCAEQRERERRARAKGKDKDSEGEKLLQCVRASCVFLFVLALLVGRSVRSFVHSFRLREILSYNK